MNEIILVLKLFFKLMMEISLIIIFIFHLYNAGESKEENNYSGAIYHALVAFIMVYIFYNL